MRERYGLTDVRKAANRMNFNQPEEEYMDGEDTVGLGTLGKEGSGRLRVAAREQKQKLTAKTAKKYAKQSGYKSGLQTSGLASLAFTPVQVNGVCQTRQAAWGHCEMRLQMSGVACPVRPEQQMYREVLRRTCPNRLLASLH